MESNLEEHDCHVFAYNTAKHASSLYSPFEVMFGRKAVLPIELSFNDEGKTLLDDYENHDTQQDSVSIYMYSMAHLRIFIIF